jgi:hypothetical protein
MQHDPLRPDPVARPPVSCLIGAMTSRATVCPDAETAETQ